MLRAEDFGLNDAYLRNDYIYLVNSRGEDEAFKGIKGDINQDITAPYAVCTVHTQQSWEEFQTANPVQPENPDTPDNPDSPDNPDNPDEPVIPDTPVR